jgi:hypothetical protein
VALGFGEVLACPSDRDPERVFVRAAADRSIAFSLAKSCSMGFRSWL